MANIGYATKRNESTRCYFCKNKCLRTFIDVSLDETAPVDEDPQAPVTPVEELPADTRRLIIATCEKGEVEDIDAMRRIKAGMDGAKKANPNLADHAARQVWKDPRPAAVADRIPRAITRKGRVRAETMRARTELRIGIPRVLNMYSMTPFFTAYLESLGVPYRNFVFSDFTSEAIRFAPDGRFGIFAGQGNVISATLSIENFAAAIVNEREVPVAKPA